MSKTMNWKESQWILSWGCRNAIFIDSWKLFLPNLRIYWLWVRVCERGGLSKQYQSSPSRKRSEGMSSMMCWGRSNAFPLRENMHFFKGFQNPRIPSYFSKIHLHSKIERGEGLFCENVREDDARGRRGEEGGEKTGCYQLEGLIWELVKKQALMGSPISSILWMNFEKKLGGGSTLIGGPSSIAIILLFIKSGRWILMLDAKLKEYHVQRKVVAWKREGSECLSSRLSHQQGTMINVIPFWRQSSFFNWSLRLSSSKLWLVEYDVSLRKWCLSCPCRNQRENGEWDCGRREEREREGANLEFEGKLKGRKEDVKFKMMTCGRIHHSCLFSCIDNHFLSLCFKYLIGEAGGGKGKGDEI